MRAQFISAGQPVCFLRRPLERFVPAAAHSGHVATERTLTVSQLAHSRRRLQLWR
jgi:hypothetical protein